MPQRRDLDWWNRFPVLGGLNPPREERATSAPERDRRCSSAGHSKSLKHEIIAEIDQRISAFDLG